MTQTNDPPTVLDIGLIPNSNEKADLDSPSDSGGKLVIGQAPNITITETTVVSDAAERLALDVQEGDIAIQTNVSTSFIFTGGDNVANNWETLDFDAVGAIDGENINPRDITATGDISLQDLTVAGAINGADTSAAAAGEALTSDGGGSLQFASVGGIEEVATFGDLPAVDPPQLAFVIGEEEYYRSFPLNGTPFEIGSASFSTSIASQDSNPKGIVWNNDGSRLYEVGLRSSRIYQYTVSTPFDITTASFSIDISTQDGFPEGIAWNNDGTKLYEVGRNSDKIYQSTLSTPFDITTASFSTDIPTQDFFSTDIKWNDDGTKLYELGQNSSKIYEYTVSTPYDINTASFSIDISTQDGRSNGIAWNNDGTKLYETGRGSSKIYQSTVSTPFDITTASFSTDIPSQDADPEGIAWNDDGSRLYEVGRNSDKIYQYTVSTGGWETF